MEPGIHDGPLSISKLSCPSAIVEHISNQFFIADHHADKLFIRLIDTSDDSIRTIYKRPLPPFPFPTSLLELDNLTLLVTSFSGSYILQLEELSAAERVVEDTITRAPDLASAAASHLPSPYRPLDNNCIFSSSGPIYPVMLPTGKLLVLTHSPPLVINQSNPFIRLNNANGGKRLPSIFHCIYPISVGSPCITSDGTLAVWEDRAGVSPEPLMTLYTFSGFNGHPSQESLEATENPSFSGILVANTLPFAPNLYSLFNQDVLSDLSLSTYDRSEFKVHKWILEKGGITDGHLEILTDLCKTAPAKSIELVLSNIYDCELKLPDNRSAKDCASELMGAIHICSLIELEWRHLEILLHTSLWALSQDPEALFCLFLQVWVTNDRHEPLLLMLTDALKAHIEYFNQQIAKDPTPFATHIPRFAKFCQDLASPKAVYKTLNAPFQATPSTLELNLQVLGCSLQWKPLPVSIPTSTLTQDHQATPSSSSSSPSSEVVQEPTAPTDSCYFHLTIASYPYELVVHPCVLYPQWSFFKRMLDMGCQEATTRRCELSSDFPPSLLLWIMKRFHGVGNIDVKLDLEAMKFLLKRGAEFGLLEFGTTNASPIFKSLVDLSLHQVLGQLSPSNILQTLQDRLDIGGSIAEQALEYVASNLILILDSSIDSSNWFQSLPDDIIVRIMRHPKCISTLKMAANRARR